MSDNGDILDPEIKEYSGGNGNGELPNAVATLVLGILSIIGCFFYGIFGVILGIIAIALHPRDRQLYKSDPAHYSASYKTANAGYICAIIGLSLSAIFVLLLIFVIASGSLASRF
jgi:hypothetical protein